MNTQVYAFLFRTYGRSPKQWIAFLLEVIRTLVMRVYLVIVMAQVTSSIASGDLVAAKRYALFFLIAYIFGAVTGMIGDFFALETNQVYGRLMLAFYQKMVGKDLSFYRDHQTGYLVSVFRQHLDNALLLVRFLRGEALGTVISLLVPPIVLWVVSPRVGVVATLVVVLQFLYVIWSSSKSHKYRHLSHELYRKGTAEVSDIITNIVAFKAGGTEERARSKLVSMIRQEVATFEHRNKIAALLELPRSIVTAFGMTAAVYLIILQATTLNPVALGLMVMTLTYMFQLIRTFGALPGLITQHDDMVTKIYPTLSYLTDEYESIQDPAQPQEFRVKRGAIEIDRISFHYTSASKKKERIPVFKDLTITINGGEQVGIVGLSGAGKSTLANLLLRFDEIDGGSIRIDGTDIRDVTQSDLRKQIAYVPQEPLLFHRTIKENIAYYHPETSQSEIIKAAKAAHAHEFIEKLSEGYDTIVGERGIKLSGGQKQRIAIARAILKKAPIILFDEATSALDSESEQIIQRALPEIIGKQTAIVVAHRLSTVAGLHRILVMHEGTVIESGTHEELLAAKGRYYSLWLKQTADFATLSSSPR